MDVKTYSDARQNFAKLMDEVCDKRAPVTVTRQGAKSVVILPLEEFESIEETLYLLRSPANAKNLLGAIDDLKAGRAVKKDPTRRRPRARK
jgi:antitoxin YefM